MKENMETEIVVLSFGIPVIAQYEKNYAFSVEQLAWLEELAMEEHLAIPISERIKNLSTNQEDESWNRKDSSMYVEQLDEELRTYQEISEYFATCEDEEFSKENNEAMEEDAGSDEENESGENELILDDCG